MKRLLLGLLVLAVLCGGIAACGAPEKDPPAGPAEPVSAPDSPEPEEEPRATGIPEPSDLPVSQTLGGWTMTLTRADGDRNCGFLYLDITAPEGVALDADTYQLNCFPYLDTPAGGGWGVDLAEDEDPADNRLSFVVDLSFGCDMRGVQGILQAQNLDAIYWSEGHQHDQRKTLIAGQWELPFRLPEQDDVITCQPRRTVASSHGPVTVETVEVGSRSVAIEFSGQTVIDHPVEHLLPEAPSRPGSIQLQLRDRDGGDLELDGSHGFPRQGGEVGLVQVFTLRQPIDPGDLEAIIIDGEEVPLTE